MTSAFELYYKIQKRIHNTKTLHLLNLLAMAGQVGFVFGGFLAYSFHQRISCSIWKGDCLAWIYALCICWDSSSSCPTCLG